MALAAVCGPALAGTSLTVVTTLATALRGLRLLVATAPDWAAALGASAVDSFAVEARRARFGVPGASVEAEAICAGAGSPLVREAWGLAVS